MKFPVRVLLATLAALAPCAGIAVTEQAARESPAGAVSTAEDRIALAGSGSTLTGTDGGEGEALSWLHNFSTDSLLALGAEHQRLGDAHWTFGSLSGSLTRPLGDGRYTFAAEAHEGAGEDGPHALHYRIEAADVTGTYFHRLSVMLEYKRIDVETTHGHLPKIQVSYLWTPHWLTTISWTDSAGGNVGTELTSVRIDRYNPVVNLLGGFTYGRASPTLIDLGIVSPGHILREGYLGASKTFARRTQATLTADYLNLSGSKRATVTLSLIIRLGSLGATH